MAYTFAIKMGADAFIAFIGIKRIIDLGADSELIELQERNHPLIRAARKNGLQFYDGRLTDGEDIFLFIGRKITVLGLENDPEASCSESELTRHFSEVAEKLNSMGIEEPPKLHLQLEADY
jgi:hypothetical protein